MNEFLLSLPVLISILVAAFLPYSILPEGLEIAFTEGGWGMRLILFAFLVSLWLVADRVVMLVRSVFDAHSFMARLRPMLRAGDISGAHEFCAGTNRPLSRIIAAGLAEGHRGTRRVRAAMDEAAYRELPEIEKRTGYLALMGNVATLMGLFGTIIGLIHSFGAVSMSSASDNATLLAAGISEAMNCTAFGLMTGITALVAFSGLNGQTQHLVDQINLFSFQAYRDWKRSTQADRPALVAEKQKPIAQPHQPLMTKTGLLKGKGHAGGRKSTFASLQLTPLIDMFIVLVIFLLLSFSASGEIVQANNNIKPPFAEKVNELVRVPIVSISNMPEHPSRGLVTLEDREVAMVTELMEDSGPDWKITKLTAQLEQLRNSWNLTHPNEQFDGKLIIQCDQDIDFRVIKRVMYSAGLAGYGNLMFAVRKKAERAA